MARWAAAASGRGWFLIERRAICRDPYPGSTSDGRRWELEAVFDVFCSADGFFEVGGVGCRCGQVVGPGFDDVGCPFGPAEHHVVVVGEEAADEEVDGEAIGEVAFSVAVRASDSHVLGVLARTQSLVAAMPWRSDSLVPCSAKKVLSSCSNSKLGPSPGSVSHSRSARRPAGVIEYTVRGRRPIASASAVA